MKVLITCEKSQAVCIEFRKLGHEAYSFDYYMCDDAYCNECGSGRTEEFITENELLHNVKTI